MLGAGAVLARFPAAVGLPCPLRTITGIPCPLCGMTTSVRETMAGDLVGAMAANPFGIGLVALVLALFLLRPTRLRIPLAPFLVLAPLSWAFQLSRFGYL